jgi:CheY-like chemotaxis protein
MKRNRPAVSLFELSVEFGRTAGIPATVLQALTVTMPHPSSGCRPASPPLRKSLSTWKKTAGRDKRQPGRRRPCPALFVRLPLQQIPTPGMLEGDTPSHRRTFHHFLNQLATIKVPKTRTDLVTMDIVENDVVTMEKAMAFRYDLVLMDLQLPVTYGLGTASRTRLNNQVPIISPRRACTSERGKRTAPGLQRPCPACTIMKILVEAYRTFETQSMVRSSPSAKGSGR